MIRGPDPEKILADPDFLSSLSRIAGVQGRRVEEALGSAESYLKEIAARPSRLMVNLTALLGRWLYRRAYGTIHYDREELAALCRLGARHPAVFLPCHRSNLDRPVMHYLLWKNHHPITYTAGGINMDFFPVGAISRRAGIFFIRRSFTEKPVYKLVLQTYFSYLIAERLPLEWYAEGGRSRTGKLRSPRYGLLGYTADALDSGKSDDVYLIPTSINYDHVLEIGAYAAEESGAVKERETFTWLVRSILSLRRQYGDIHVRFGEPLSVRDTVEPDRTGSERRKDLRRLAFAVCARINRITPVTPSSLVAVALLAGPEGGIPRPNLQATVTELVDHVESRNLPTTGPLSLLRSRRGLSQALDALVNLGFAAADTGASENGRPRSVYRAAAGQRLAIAYYRNTIVHFFVVPAVTELALAAASRGEASDSPYQTFLACVAKVRELFVYEFFLADHETLIDEITTELDRRQPSWKDRLIGGRAAGILADLRPHRAPWALRSFAEAYLVVAEELVALPSGQPWNRRSFLKACLDRSTEHVNRRRISAEASSLSLFAGAVRLAARRGLLEPGRDDLSRRREDLVSELDLLLGLIDSLDSVTGTGEGVAYGHRIGNLP